MPVKREKAKDYDSFMQQPIYKYYRCSSRNINVIFFTILFANSDGFRLLWVLGNWLGGPPPATISLSLDLILKPNSLQQWMHGSVMPGL